MLASSTVISICPKMAARWSLAAGWRRGPKQGQLVAGRGAQGCSREQLAVLLC